MGSKQHYVYTLECNDGSYYTGYTNDLCRRMKAHETGKAAKYTRGRAPVQLVYARSFETKSEAMSAEYHFKQLTRKQKELIIKESSLDSSICYESKERTVMWQQKSYRDKAKKGTLYLVPTPIGNLEDMTFRAVRMLKEADTIAAEDTRQTKKLCNHFEIETPLVSHHEHNKEKSGEALLEKLETGQMIALVSDAGMPAISDPGYELTAECIKRQIPVIPLPGANAGLTSLVASGLATDHFFFYGFLPRSKKARGAELERLESIRETIIFYEAPHRLKEMIGHLHQVFGLRKLSIARELTKRYEEFVRGTTEDVIEWVGRETPKGEFCVIVEGTDRETEIEEQWWETLSIYEHVQHYVTIRNMRSKEAVKKTAHERGLPKREVYQAYHVDSEQGADPTDFMR